MNQPQLGNLESIAIAAIRPSSTNPRKHFDDTQMNELRDSIKAMGVTQPILVRELPGFVVDDNDDPNEVYVIVSGERRWRAAKYAGLTSIPAFVRELSDAEALETQMVENLQRQDLHPMEEADGYRVLIAGGLSAEDVAKKAGKTLGYVQQRLKLLTLEIDARQLFLDQHLTLGHALRLALLTPSDQERALRHMLRLEGDYARMKLVDAIRQRHTNHRSYTPNTRLTSTTEAELQIWIRENVLLQLKGVPWDLADADLLPAAGACTTCPKRTGASAALFADITTAEDTCTDRVCFADKQRAFVALEQQHARDAGSPLLKLTVKRGVEKLPAPVVELKPGPLAAGNSGQKTAPTVKAVVVAKKAVKEGQWMEARRGECPLTVQAIYTDGPKTGQTRYVCADQACKVHKHQVETPRSAGTASSGGSAAKALPPEEQKHANDLREWERKRDRFVVVQILRVVYENSPMKDIEVIRHVVRSAWEQVEYYADTEAIGEALKLKPLKHKTSVKPTMAGAIENFIDKSKDQNDLLDLAAVLYAAGEEGDKTSAIAKRSGAGSPVTLVTDFELEFADTNPKPVKPEAEKPAAAKGGTKVAQAAKKSSSAKKSPAKTAPSKRPRSGTAIASPSTIDGKSAAAGEAAEARA